MSPWERRGAGEGDLVGSPLETNRHEKSSSRRGGGFSWFLTRPWRVVKIWQRDEYLRLNGCCGYRFVMGRFNDDCY